jgi:mannose/cellobiose epimerase-like protein (N-acyl-D-glucosamine 2-epimerase family)
MGAEQGNNPEMHLNEANLETAEQHGQHQHHPLLEQVKIERHGQSIPSQSK